MRPGCPAQSNMLELQQRGPATLNWAPHSQYLEPFQLNKWAAHSNGSQAFLLPPIKALERLTSVQKSTYQTTFTIKKTSSTDTRTALITALYYGCPEISFLFQKGMYDDPSSIGCTQYYQSIHIAVLLLFLFTYCIGYVLR